MAELALAWVLGAARRDCSPRRRPAARADRGERRAADPTVSPEVLGQLALITDDLKAKLGTNLDQYQSQSRFR